MLIRDIFETRIEEKIEPVIKVGERHDEKKLAAEIGSYVVTPTIEQYLDNFLEHYTDTFRLPTTEIGVWISGYFGSGKSHLAKIAALLVENRVLDGVATAKRFESRIPPQAPRRDSIVRSLFRLSQGDSQVMAFNLNTLADSRTTPLPRLLLSQYYQAQGYGSNFLYARVIEAELDRRGKLAELHTAVERLAGRPWNEVQANPNFYAKSFYRAACEVAPEVFASPEEVLQALRNAEKGELYNVQFLVQTILDGLARREQMAGKPCRLVLVLDESGQWIEDDAGRLAQLQALVEESAAKGQGKIWVFVTTHEDMGSIYQNARALKGDMKKIEGRFRFKFNLTTENIELVLEDRLFKKKLAGQREVSQAYQENPGVLRDLGELKNANQKLPPCVEERFVNFYPFFPYHIYFIPEIVKSLRSAGGRGEQLSGSTRTLLAIAQDIMRAGRRDYLNTPVGEMVTFDEVYANLAGEGEVNADVRREIKRIEEVVPDATSLTRRAAEVLYLLQQLTYVPRTIDNLARLLVEQTSDDLAVIINRLQPELTKLVQARMVARIGEEYEFLTGERRTFEEDVANEKADLKMQNLESGLAKLATTDLLGFTTVPFKGAEFPARLYFDDTVTSRDGSVDIRVYSPLAAMTLKPPDLEDRSLRPDEQQTIFVLCDRVPGFDEQLKYYLAMQTVVDRWKGDPGKSPDAHRLASERESNDLDKVRRRVVDGIQTGLRQAQIIFRGSSRALFPKSGQSSGEALRLELATFWPTLYPKYERVPVRIVNEQRAILDVLNGNKNLTSDVQSLRLLDAAGQLDRHAPLLDALRTYLTTRQERQERTLGRDLLNQFTPPPYGWDAGAIRVGIAALVRAGDLRVVLNKKPFTNPADPELQNALRVSREFDRVELVLEETEPDPEVLLEVRKLLLRLAGLRKLDETPAALAEVMGTFAAELLQQAAGVARWAEPADLPLPPQFYEGREVFEKLLALTNPLHRVNEIQVQRDHLTGYVQAIRQAAEFVDKGGKTFLEMREFAFAIVYIADYLPPGGSAQTFLSNWRTARQQASLIEAGVWRELQQSKATAGLELEQQVAARREAARQEIEATLSTLPQELAARGLSAEELQETLTARIRAFLANLTTEADLARLANQPSQLVRELRQAIQAEVDKRRPQPKPVRPIRIRDVVKYSRIETVKQWEQIRDRLDEAVKNALAAGDEVEIN